MQAASLLIALMTVLISALILLAMVKGNAWSSILPGLRRNMPWLAVLLFAMALDLGINLLVPNPPYLVRMSAQTEIFAGISIWLQAAIPASIGPTFFATVYYMGFAIFVIALPLYLLAMKKDIIFKRYCLSLALASLLLVFFKLIVLSVRPTLDPGSGSVGPLFSDPFWGRFLSTYHRRGTVFPAVMPSP